MRSVIPSVVAALVGFVIARLIFSDSAPADLPSATAPVSAAPRLGPPIGKPELTDIAGESKPAPTLKEVQAAINGSDIFVAAAKWEAWLDSASAEDLEKLASDPKSLPEPWASDYYHQFRNAFYTALVERWFAVNENALPSIRKLYDAFKATNDYEAWRIMDAATKARPELFLTDLTEKKSTLSREEISALRSLAARDARRARELASLLPEKARKSAEAMIIQGIAESDPLSALALSRSLGPSANRQDERSVHAAIIAAAERIGPGMLKQVFADANGAFDDDYTARMLLLRYPELGAHLKAEESNPKMGNSPFPNPTLFREADLMTTEDRARRVEQITGMPEGVRDSAAAALAASWARDEPLKAAEWAMKLAKPDVADSSANQAAHFAFLRWIHVDRDAAVAWLRSQPESPLRNAIGTNAASFLAEAGDFAAAMEFCRPTSSKPDQDALVHLVQIYAERDPAGTAAWLTRVPEAISLETASRLFASWDPRDSAALGRWVEGLPAGKGRDQAVNALVQKLRWDSPDAAAEWAETVVDPVLRQKTAECAFYTLNRDDPARAREWLQNLKGVDPQWKERLIKDPQ